jgi:tetratricopeptide (TPR) repeat protein
MAELPPVVRERLRPWMANPGDVPLGGPDDAAHLVRARAFVHLQSCIDVSPEDRWAAETLATQLDRRAGLLTRGEQALADAETDLLRAVALVPWSAEFVYQLALVRLQASGGNPRSPSLPLALRTFDLVLQLHDGHEKAMSQRGVCLSLLGRNDDAEKMFETAITKRPDSVENLYNYATHLARLGRVEEAREYARRAAEVFPEMSGLAELVRDLGSGE